MVIAATEEEVVTGKEADPEVEPPPVVSLSMVSQPGLPRRQVYYPHIAWRLSRVLQVRTYSPNLSVPCSSFLALPPGVPPPPRLAPVARPAGLICLSLFLSLLLPSSLA